MFQKEKPPLHHIILFAGHDAKQPSFFRVDLELIASLSRTELEMSVESGLICVDSDKRKISIRKNTQLINSRKILFQYELYLGDDNTVQGISWVRLATNVSGKELSPRIDTAVTGYDQSRFTRFIELLVQLRLL